MNNQLQIGLFIQCGECMKEVPDGLSPQEYAYVSVGWTELGLQVWCNRHNCNILNIDFEGQKHPADISRPVTKKPLLKSVK